MKRLTALALLAVAVGAIMHFWPSGEQQSVAPSTSRKDASRAVPPPPSGNPTPAQQSPTTSALSPERTAQPGKVDPTRVAPVRLDLRAPNTVRSGDTFPVTIDVQAFQGLRQLAFSVTYKKSILRLTGSSPGPFAQQGGIPVHFEESSDGHLIVRIDRESGVIAGAGSVAVLEFRALNDGVSPLSVQDVSYLEVGRQETAAVPTMHEASITVE